MGRAKRKTSKNKANGLLIGYARVSTQEQSLSLQKDALTKVGCEKIFTDKITGTKNDRPGLSRAIDALRQGDTLVVWKLDRLGRSLPHLVKTVTELNENNIGFRSLQEALDTTSSVGKLVFHIFASLAEFERDIIRERTMAGLASARARGRLGGRPKALDASRAKQVRVMHRDPKISVKEICDTLGVGRSTVYRYLDASS